MVSEEALEEKEKRREGPWDDKYTCVFYQDTSCPVQEKLAMDEKLKPLKSSQFEEITERVFDRFPFNYMSLAGFCAVCPILEEKRYESRKPVFKPTHRKPSDGVETINTEAEDPEEIRDKLYNLVNSLVVTKDTVQKIIDETKKLLRQYDDLTFSGGGVER